MYIPYPAEQFWMGAGENALALLLVSGYLNNLKELHLALNIVKAEGVSLLYAFVACSGKYTYMLLIGLMESLRRLLLY